MALSTLPLAKLSGSTDGRPIKIAATATPGTTLHTAVTGTTLFDEVSIDYCNTDTTARKVTTEEGGTTSPDDTSEMTIPPESGWVPALVRARFQNAVVIRAFAAAANVVIARGRVNTVTPS